MSRKLFHKTDIKKILLIDPRGFGAGLNLGIGYVASALLKNNYEIKVIDCNNLPERLSQGPRLNLSGLQFDDWRAKIRRGLEWGPDAVAIAINSFTQLAAYEIAEFCHENLGDGILYLAGGPHLTVYKGKFMEKNHHLFDIGVIGEGEETVIDLLNNLDQPEAVKGITYWDDDENRVIQTVDRPILLDLNALPFPNFDYFDTVNTTDGLYNYQMVSSRGCPYECVFCSLIHTKRWRARSPENVLEEIKMARQKFHAQTVTFWDDNFTLHKDRVKKICDALIAEKWDLKFSLAGVRADLIDEELVSKLKEAGCNGISMGIEEGDQEVFPFVKKGESLEQIASAVRLVQSYKIPLSCYMITGLINSSYASFQRSLSYIEKLRVGAHWNIAFPLPLTSLNDWVHENGRFLMTVEEGFRLCMTSKNPPVVFDTPEYPKEQRLKAFYVGNLRCRSYDMVVGTRSGSFVGQVLDIIEAVWKYDRERLWWHFSYLFKVFSASIINGGRIKLP
jgi:radical SAM superfamily enzyme YgiQ (UPF0313 family)